MSGLDPGALLEDGGALEPGPAAWASPPALRALAAALPAAPGVYVFCGDEGGLPLYIGKSINLRARVLSHLRNPDEARLIGQTRRFEHQRTAGEVGALLLEAQLIKQRQPVWNKKLRRNRQLCALRLHQDQVQSPTAPEVVYARDLDFATEPELFGLYASRHAAIEALHQLADAQRLCLGALGLERLARGRACFRAQLGHCAGVCCGRETPEAHQQRLRQALHRLQLVCWPYPGAVGLVETWDQPPGPTLRQIHVVRNWCYLGSAATPDEARTLDRVVAAFDADSYQILCPHLLPMPGRSRPELLLL